MFSKKRIRFIVISKIELRKFQINLMLKFCLSLELLKLIWNFYSLRVTIFSFNFDFKILATFCCLQFFLPFAFFSNFFQFFFINLSKFDTKKNMVVKEKGLVQLSNAFTKLCYFYFLKGNEGKIY